MPFQAKPAQIEQRCDTRENPDQDESGRSICHFTKEITPTLSECEGGNFQTGISRRTPLRVGLGDKMVRIF
jgi:hypothetical protein